MAKSDTNEQKAPTFADFLVRFEFLARSCFSEAAKHYAEAIEAGKTPAEAQKLADSEVLAIRNLIVKATETLTNIRQTWDNQHDMRSMFGADVFSAKVERIRKATEKKEKAEEVNPLDAFTL